MNPQNSWECLRCLRKIMCFVCSDKTVASLRKLNWGLSLVRVGYWAQGGTAAEADCISSLAQRPCTFCRQNRLKEHWITVLGQHLATCVSVRLDRWKQFLVSVLSVEFNETRHRAGIAEMVNWLAIGWETRVRIPARVGLLGVLHALTWENTLWARTCLPVYLCEGKGKAVPLHAMEAHGGRGGIAPTHA
jgi:hypothetical protein